MGVLRQRASPHVETSGFVPLELYTYGLRNGLLLHSRINDYLRN